MAAFFGTFDTAAYMGACPNKACFSKSPSSCSPNSRSFFAGMHDCSCQDTSFGGVFMLPSADDGQETPLKVRAQLAAQSPEGTR